MMRSKTYTYILTSAVALLLCLATLFSAGGTVPTEASSVPDMNFGVPSAENNTTLSPSALLEKLYPTLELSAAEDS